ncbi:J domain-containing protein [Natronolimnohabitans innermongolicus]|uniref:Chaperone protein DnaJ n=1 Tax=Natronolimnohabitans innermongolicus JCM 12255 TaxID=1227499 RepID=L9X6F8_9EURY|nr:DnaJ domain-containing protein [Natronolimnohabitans innermongolicus]ELY57384.1 chaperone protein DnaJ [Natronolimnohabitans innermongolicus JCM 12255]
MTEDFYDLLEVSSDASQDEIKDAYREQVRVYHPDHNDDDRARAQFTAVKKAYDILGDPVERQAYDRLGHQDYVAKRTSGLPSPDVWRSTANSADGSDAGADATSESTASGTTFTYDDESATDSSGATSATSSAASASAAGAGSAGTASTGSRAGAGAGTGSGSGTGTTSTGNAASSASASTAGARTGSETGAATATGAAGTTDGGTAHGTASSSGSSRGAPSQSRDGEPGRFGDNAVVRWWRRQNFSLPLIWLSLLVYLGGLVHFRLENEAGLESLRAELAAAGTDAGAALDALTAERYGIDGSLEYLAAWELVAPPLEAPLWDAALAGVVGLTLLALLGARAYGDGETWRPVSIDETIVVALAVTATTVLVGGPLLAGAVLLPMLVAVIIRHTRRGPGWKPSYVYVVPVLAPLAGLGLAAAGEATLATDLLAFVVLPLLGGLSLPLRVSIRKRFGR